MKKTISVLMAVVILFTSVCFVPTVSAATVAPKKITLSKTFKTVYIGQNYKLKVTAVTPKKADKMVTWKTSNPKVATVDKNGVVKGKKKGTVTITATSTKNKRIKTTCKIKVRKFKNTNLNYKSKFITSAETFTMLYLEGEPQEDPHIIRTYTQLQKLKERIKYYYDCRYFYSLYADVFPNPEMDRDKWYAKRGSGNDILKILDSYDKNFFKNNVLYYNCQIFTNQNVLGTVNYSFKCTKVTKKVLNGKLTCVMDIKREIKNIKSYNGYKGNTVVSFITLSKKDMGGVQVYKPRYYEYFDLPYSEGADERYLPDIVD